MKLLDLTVIQYYLIPFNQATFKCLFQAKALKWKFYVVKHFEPWNWANKILEGKNYF